jgi:hypothetical protein
MSEAAKKYFKDIRFWVPALMLAGLELFLQSGVYGRYMLEKHSAADNVRSNVKILRNSSVQPNALILGTSVAYQGLDIGELNAALNETGASIVAQSAACEGCMLQTQHLMYRVLKDRWPGMNTIIHVADTTLSSKARYEFDPANGSMMAQFARGEALELLRLHEFNLSYRDRLYFYVRAMTYQQDLREFVLNPLRRIRTIGERLRTPLPDYTHINDNLYSYGAFSARGDLAACAHNAVLGIDDDGNPVPEKKDGEKLDPAVHRTDRHHRNAVHVTCNIANLEKNQEPAGEAQWRKLYFRRVKALYDEIYADGRRVITIIPPYSDLILHANTDERIARWRKNLAAINAGRDYAFIDMRRSLNSFDSPEGRKYFYDVLHLNAEGSLVWTREVAAELTAYESMILADRRPGR